MTILFVHVLLLYYYYRRSSVGIDDIDYYYCVCDSIIIVIDIGRGWYDCVCTVMMTDYSVMYVLL